MITAYLLTSGTDWNCNKWRRRSTIDAVARSVSGDIWNNLLWLKLAPLYRRLWRKEIWAATFVERLLLRLLSRAARQESATSQEECIIVVCDWSIPWRLSWFLNDAGRHKTTNRTLAHLCSVGAFDNSLHLWSTIFKNNSAHATSPSSFAFLLFLCLLMAVVPFYRTQNIPTRPPLTSTLNGIQTVRSHC